MAATIANSTTNTTGADGAAGAFPSNPFVGLRPFNSGEALLFFGRGAQTVELLRRLHRDHFIAVVGGSGCGKSSLVRAGLIPKLRAGFLTEDRDRWLVAVMKPGGAPLRNLAAALIEAIPAGGDVEDCAKAIRAGGAQAVIEQLSPSLAHSDANLLLLVDQFEEIFRFGVESSKAEQRAEAEDFVSIMLALAEQRSLPIYVVMTMRSDFLGDCDHFHGLPEAMNHGQYLVPRLTRRQRQQAIEGPIRLFGASISARLLDRALNDVGDKSDQLPVMQHALMRTWEEWEREATGRRGDGESGRDENSRSQSPNPESIQVDLPHYEAAGGIRDAMSKDAEAALDGINAYELKVAERMFQALTDTDARNRRVRRPAHLSEIVDITRASRKTVLKIIERFRGGGRSFLTVSNDEDPLIDISHESLIRQWWTMGKWVKAEARSREIYQRLANSARRLRAAGRGELYRGTDLQEAAEWWAQREPNRAWAHRYEQAPKDYDLARRFLEDSQRAEEGQRKHELQQQRRRVKQLRWMLLVLLLFLANATANKIRAYKERDNARRAETMARNLKQIAENARKEVEEKKKIVDELAAKLDSQNRLLRVQNYQLLLNPMARPIRNVKPVKAEQFDDALKQIMPTLPQTKRRLYTPFLRKAMVIYEIDTPLRQAAFLAQIAHESAELRFVIEIWGPTSLQLTYEPPSDRATSLGNTQPGDGFRFRGRGPFRLTGRAYYKKFGDLLGLDLVNNPDLAATPQGMFDTAGLIWKLNGLNELADKQDFEAITKQINGGLSGLAERRQYYQRAKVVLGASDK